MLTGLLKRWQSWSTVTLEVPLIDLKQVMVTDLELASAAGDWSKGGAEARHTYTLSGSIGFLRLAVPDQATANVTDTLLRFAEYSGVGAYTARGFGVVRLRRTRQPRGSAERVGAAAEVEGTDGRSR